MIHYKYSRLNRIQEKQTRWQIMVASFFVVALIILIAKIGIPALFSFTLTLASLRQGGPDPSTEQSLEIPTPPVLEAPYTATNTASIKLTGSAEPENTVVIFRNGNQLTSETVGADGQFEFNSDLLRGSNLFTAQIVSATGKNSALSQALEIFYLTSAPDLEVTEPKDGDTLNQDSIDIVGKTDDSVGVTINDRSAVVGSDGAFRFFYRLQGGDNKIAVVATDKAGNSTKIELTVKKP